MAIRFNKFIRLQATILNLSEARQAVFSKTAVSPKMVFMSHKTGDRQAEEEAKYINRKHGVEVYLVEWDDNVGDNSDRLPEHIMDAIRKSDGFLVHVIAEIAVSMWIGYEIGGAHAMGKSRAKIMYNRVSRLPTVVNVLESLLSRYALDRWILREVK